MHGIWVIGSKTNTKMVNKGRRQEKLRNVMTEAHDPAILAAIGNKTPQQDRCCTSERKLSRSCGITEFRNFFARVQASRDGFKFTHSSVNNLHEIRCRICYFCGFLQLSRLVTARDSVCWLALKPLYTKICIGKSRNVIQSEVEQQLTLKFEVSSIMS